MKSLAERHEDRAQRLADNRAESGLVNTGSNGNLGRVANMIAETTSALRGLSESERAELENTMRDVSIGSDGFQSAAMDDDGNLALAGIGAVNTGLVPPDRARELGNTAAANGQLPEPSFDPAKGNLNGAAIEAAGSPAGGGWGTSSGDGYGALSLNELKTEADRRDPKVSYDPKVKDTQEGKDGLIAALRADDKRLKEAGAS